MYSMFEAMGIRINFENIYNFGFDGFDGTDMDECMCIEIIDDV